MDRIDDARSASTSGSYSEGASWDIFHEEPRVQAGRADSAGPEGSTALRVAKLLVCGLASLLVLGSAVTAKSALLFAASQLRRNPTVQFCTRSSDMLHSSSELVRFEATLPEEERVAWVWVLLGCLLAPEVGSLLRAARKMLFKPKSWERPRALDLAVVVTLEVCGTVGVAMLSFSVLPDLDVLSGVMLTNCVCLLPALLVLLRDAFPVPEKFDLEGKASPPAPSPSLSTTSSGRGAGPRWLLETPTRQLRLVRLVLGSAALLAQLGGWIAWPLAHPERPGLWLTPAALLLASCAWWENYVTGNSSLRVLRFLADVKARQERVRYPVYLVATLVKMVTLFGSMLIIWVARGESVPNLFNLFGEAFRPHWINVTETLQVNNLLSPSAPASETPGSSRFAVLSWPASAPCVLLAQVAAAYLCYITGKFSCRILAQGLSFATPVTLATSITLSLLIALCGLKFEDPCAFKGAIPDYLFFAQPNLESQNLFSSLKSLVWLLWLASQIWVTLHIWWPQCQRLAPTETIFVTPMYSALLIDQSLALNRRLDDQPAKARVKELRNNAANILRCVQEDRAGVELCASSEAGECEEMGPPEMEDAVPKLFACATMWHETREEMMEMLKSIIRLDEDQSAHRVAREYLCDPSKPPKDYYEFETHIFFDDAFVSEVPVRPDSGLINSYVRDMLRTVDEAASHVHETRVRLRPPLVVTTPYGGQLRWTLPGQTRLVVHLKNSAKIRHKKRWSQVMYMYYLLGFRLLGLPVSSRRKDVVAENTYLLALDGDIDFKPSAVHKLIDLMRKDRNLGAACGRIHPVGAGAMQWYQKFEYAVGHWLQKATEHVIGCVLCSPGCFSLFRGSALMDTNVMRKYTTVSEEARHYVQYDQGEDRWLCTLLLQRGYRVEYSAASDAFTHCPEGFNEFYNQRRRWVPSTMANIMDLLGEAKQTIRVNDNISIPYIIYQWVLLVGAVLGPGTILLLLIGAFVNVFGWREQTSLVVNGIPVVIFMVICYFAKNDTQITVAGVYTIVYALVMIAVIVGIMVQISDDGPLAPSSLFFFFVAGQLIVTALLHPRELDCLPAGVIYFITVPSMYMLLIIYSLFNLNNVSWGTRELPKPPGEAPRANQMVAENKIQNFTSGLRTRMIEISDGSSRGLSAFFNYITCSQSRGSYERIPTEDGMHRIADVLESINQRMEQLEKRAEREESPPQCASQQAQPAVPQLVVTGPPEDLVELTFSSQLDEPISNVENGETLLDLDWIKNDPVFKRCKVESLTEREERFWTDLIKKYLKPIEKDKEKQARVSKELKDLRDKMIFGFFMLNAMFVYTLFLIQMHRDISFLNIRWPLRTSSKINFNITRSGETEWHVHVTTQSLTLEPIGMLLLLSFGLVMFVQFLAMLYHRCATFTHIMATTSIACYCTAQASSGERDMSRKAVEIARELQRLRTLAEEEDEQQMEEVDTPLLDSGPRRDTIQQLERRRSLMPRPRVSLAEAFQRRLLPTEDQGDEDTASTRVLRRLTGCPETFDAFMRHRSSMMERRSVRAGDSAESSRSATPRLGPRLSEIGETEV